MSGLPVWAGVVVLVTAIVAAEIAIWRVLVVPRLRARLADARHEATIVLGGDVVHAGTARFVGLTSRGRAQARGTGHLAIGREEMVFVRLAPRWTLRIARARVDVVDTTRSHLGKAVGHHLLRVAFRDEAGAADVVAFDVGRDTRPWEEALAAG